jgi:hypothetical protein
MEEAEEGADDDDADDDDVEQEEEQEGSEGAEDGGGGGARDTLASQVDDGDGNGAPRKRRAQQQGIQFLGKCLRVGDMGEKLFSAFKFEGVVYRVGDAVLVRVPSSLKGCKNQLWVAEISCAWQDVYREQWMEVRWYYAPRQTLVTARSLPVEPGELYESDHVDENTIDCIMRKAYVLPHAAYLDRLAQFGAASPNMENYFFARSFYTCETGFVRPCLAVERRERLGVYSKRLRGDAVVGLKAMLQEQDQEQEQEQEQGQGQGQGQGQL